jgi:hypothetical protein
MLRAAEQDRPDVASNELCRILGDEAIRRRGLTALQFIVDSGKFPWKQHADRFPMFNQPDRSYHGLVYTDHFGEAAYIARCRSALPAPGGSAITLSPYRRPTAECAPVDAKAGCLYPNNARALIERGSGAVN